jgi:hypothetical protein
MSFALSVQATILRSFSLSSAIRVRGNSQVQRGLPAVLVAPPVVIPVTPHKKA